jgi:hypothetical protein
VPEAAEEDEEADGDPSDEGETHAATAVGAAEVVADGAAEAIDERSVGVAEVARPHAEALREATTTMQETAHPEANLMLPRVRSQAGITLGNRSELTGIRADLAMASLRWFPSRL